MATAQPYTDEEWATHITLKAYNGSENELVANIPLTTLQRFSVVTKTHPTPRNIQQQHAQNRVPLRHKLVLRSKAPFNPPTRAVKWVCDWLLLSATYPSTPFLPDDQATIRFIDVVDLYAAAEMFILRPFPADMVALLYHDLTMYAPNAATVNLLYQSLPIDDGATRRLIESRLRWFWNVKVYGKEEHRDISM